MSLNKKLSSIPPPPDSQSGFIIFCAYQDMNTKYSLQLLDLVFLNEFSWEVHSKKLITYNIKFTINKPRSSNVIHRILMNCFYWVVLFSIITISVNERLFSQTQKEFQNIIRQRNFRVEAVLITDIEFHAFHFYLMCVWL